jgi:hypothetical protein
MNCLNKFEEAFHTKTTHLFSTISCWNSVEDLNTIYCHSLLSTLNCIKSNKQASFIPSGYMKHMLFGFDA